MLRPTSFLRLLPWMTVFFLAMAYLESAVVVYLRALYYPAGFGFPIVPMDRTLVSTELWREVATMIMLLAPAAFVTRSMLGRFAWFCYGFGVWDLGYYAWLKVLLDWPSSWRTWDLLFLLPLPWVGPVWAPCLIAFGLVVLSVYLLYRLEKDPDFGVPLLAWFLLIMGALLMIISFAVEPLMSGMSLDDMTLVTTYSDPGGVGTITGKPYIPSIFPWTWYLAGWVVSLFGVVVILSVPQHAK